jgi:hypothetical protein
VLTAGEEAGVGVAAGFGTAGAAGAVALEVVDLAPPGANPPDEFPAFASLLPMPNLTQFIFQVPSDPSLS